MQSKYLNVFLSNFIIETRKVRKPGIWYGNCIGLLYNSRGNPWITIGPDFGYSICLLSCVTVLCGIGSFLWYRFETSLSFVKPCVALIIFVNYFSLLCTMLLNPGHPDVYEGLPKSTQWCKKCQAPRRDRDTYHCYDCGKWWNDYDHHCPFMGKCIGGGNIIPFYTFIGTFMVLMVTIFLMVGFTLQELEAGKKVRG